MLKQAWLSALAGIVCLSGAAYGAGWGDVTIQFVVDGKAPEPKAVKVDKDPAVCGKHKLTEESFIVGKEGGIKDVVMFISPAVGAKVPVHSDYDAPAEKSKKVILDNKACRFEPHIAVMRTGQVLVLKNSDPVGHNSKVDFLINSPQNPLIPAGAQIEIKDIAKAEKRATQVSCSIHPWMSGWVVVQDHPYAAASGDDGVITLKNVPEGKWSFQLWQEAIGYVTVAKDKAGKETSWKKGKAEFEIKAGANDLGVFKVAPPK